jgi:hypothetical protein
MSPGNGTPSKARVDAFALRHRVTLAQARTIIELAARRPGPPAPVWVERDEPTDAWVIATIGDLELVIEADGTTTNPDTGEHHP